MNVLRTLGRRASHDFVQVSFALEHDADGYPPIQAETLWCRPRGGDRYEVDNIPFFVPLLSARDVVLARTQDDGMLHAQDKLEYGGHCTIRLVPDRVEEIQAIRRGLSALGCESEWAKAWRLIAVDVPPNTNIRAVRRHVEAGAEQKRWDYEEAAISEAWRTALDE